MHWSIRSSRLHSWSTIHRFGALIFGALLLSGTAAHATNEIQKITLTGVTAAQVEIGDGQGTANFAPGATATQVKTTLESLPSIGTGNVSVSGSSAAGGQDLTGSGTPTASGNYGPGYEADKAFDNNLNTSWASATGSGPDWLRYDFGSGQSKVITEYTFQLDANSYTRPTAWSFDGSADGSTWTSLHSLTGQSISSGTRYAYTFTNSTAYRYYRLNITSKTYYAPMYFAAVEMIGAAGIGHSGVYTAEFIGGKANTNLTQLTTTTTGVTITTEQNGAPTAPTAPGVATFADITTTTLTVNLPALPADAATLSLQKKLASEADSEYVSIATGLAGNAAQPVTGLAASTSYAFRAVAVNPYGSTPGAGANVSTTAPPQAPAPVTLNALSIDEYSNSVSLSWSQSGEADFASYKIYRATTAGVTTQSTLVTTITQSDQISYNDYSAAGSPAPGTTYSYRVFVFDTEQLSAGSNEESILRLDEAPAAVILDTPTYVDNGYEGRGVQLSWSASTATDLAQYKLYRSEQPNVDEQDTLVATLTPDPLYGGGTSHFDSTVVPLPAPGRTYYYRVFVVDAIGQSTGSNEQSITVVDSPPAAVTLNTPTFEQYYNVVSLSWSQNTESDFASYKIYRATQAGVTTQSTLIATITQASETSYNDATAPATVPPGTTYYYRVFVFDAAGQSTGSNEASILRINPPPSAVTLQPLTVDMTYNNPRPKLVWSPSNESDFVSYKIYRATVAGVTTQSTLAATITAIGTTQYVDNDAPPTVPPGTTYYYRVFVFDSAAQNAGSNEESIFMRDDPPAAVVLDPPVRVTGYDQNGVKLSWSFSTTLDLREYRVFRATHANVTEQDHRVAVIDGAPPTGATKWEYIDYAPASTGTGTTYYYKVFVVDMANQVAPSNEESITMIYVPLPEAPGTPEISNVTQTSLAATMPGPLLPARAGSLTLEIKLASQADSFFAAVPNGTGLAPEAIVPVTGLLSDTDYRLRCVAVGAGGSTPGPVVGVRTGTDPPPPHGPPTFINGTSHSVQVEVPALQANTTWLNLQIKVDGQPDSAYRYVAVRLGYDPEYGNYTAPPVLVDDLLTGMTYTFRFVAVGPGGTTVGPSANWTVPTAAVAWAAGGSIQSGGISWPTTGATIAAGGQGHLSSYLATDWDFRQTDINGTVTSSWFSDTCNYTWSAVDAQGNPAGSFPQNRNKGHGVVWVAPTTAGTYTIRLTVDDQSAANQPASEAGSRDDVGEGYNDDPVKFTATVTVQP